MMYHEKLISPRILRERQPVLYYSFLLLSPPTLHRFAAVYAWLRVTDDIVDTPGRDPAAVRAYVAGAQQWLAGKERPADPPGLVAPERVLRDGLDQELRSSWDPFLQAVVEEMMEAIAWDTGRPERVEEEALNRQCHRIGRAYVRGLWYCLGGGIAPREAEDLGTAATVIHQVRDLEEDLALGYINLPGSLGSADPQDPRVRAWLVQRTQQTIHILETQMLQGSWRCRLMLGLLSWRYARKGRQLLGDLKKAGA